MSLKICQPQGCREAGPLGKGPGSAAPICWGLFQ